MVDSRPAVNDLIVLRSPEGREFRSRVEGLSATVLTVSAPLDLPAEGSPGPGSDLLVTWRHGRGVAVLPVRILEAFREGDLLLWSLGFTGEGWVEQRRDFVRVPAGGPVTLTPQDAPDVVGRMVDVSEAAMRCAVAAAAAETLEAPGTPLTVRFRIGTRDFEIPGSVAFRREGTSHVELVIAFDEPVRESDALRKQIYAQQLRAARHD